MKRFLYICFFVMRANRETLENEEEKNNALMIKLLDDLEIEEDKISEESRRENLLPYFIKSKIDIIRSFNSNAQKKLFFIDNDIPHREAKNFLMNLSKKQSNIDSIKRQLKKMQANEISFILLNKKLVEKAMPNKKLVEYIMENCELEFDKKKFFKLSISDQEKVLKNLVFPLDKAKECYKKWIKMEYDLKFLEEFTYLSPVGLSFFLLLILHSNDNLKKAEDSYVLSESVLVTFNMIMADERFGLGKYSESSKKDRFSYFQFKFKEKYMTEDTIIG